MIVNNEKCLDPWMGFLIILAVCVVILIGIFNEFRGGSHHARLHGQTVDAMTQAGFINPSPVAQSPAAEITF